MQPRHPETVGRFESDRGSLIPEFALAAPLLIFGLLAIFEFGMGYRERINIESAVRSAARQDSNLGDTRPADYEALVGFQSVMTRAKHMTINRVVVYLATGSDGSPSNASCLTTAAAAGTTPSGISGACNIYSNGQIQALVSDPSYLTHFGPNDTSCTNAWDQYWCPIVRNADQGDPPDYLGVYANLTYTSYTKLIPNTITMTDRAVMRIEPKV